MIILFKSVVTDMWKSVKGGETLKGDNFEVFLAEINL
jgi:hypothetical protein